MNGSNGARHDLCETQGSLALKPERGSRLVLIQGGKAMAAAGDSRRPASAKAFVIAATLVITLIAACGLLQESLAASRRAALLADAAEQSYVVREGDSAWSLAEAHPIDGLSTSDVAAHILEERGQQGSALTPGETILIPA